MRIAVAQWHVGVALLAAVFLAGCAGESNQSAMDPAGPAAAEIAWLWWIMFWVFTAVFVLVMLLLLGALYGKRDRSNDDQAQPPLGPNGFIVAGGFLLPIMVVTPLYLLSLKTSASIGPPREALTVRIVGHMWWWEVRYPEQDIVTANEIHIPAGQPVRLELASADVIHSFWAPRLHGKRDLIPGVENVFWIEADEPGIFRGQCAEYCGTQHANMAFQVIALPADEFDAWLAERSNPAVDPAVAQARRGFEVFMSAGCAQCHAVRGTPANGNVGPDLSHIGSRQMIGAAMLSNTRGNLMGWIADPQAIKPGVKMPRTYLDGDSLLALVVYLEGLR